MRLLTFRFPTSVADRFGAILSNGQVLDLTGLDRHGMPVSLLGCIQQGPAALAVVRSAVVEAEATLKAGGAVTGAVPYADVTVQLPYVPGKVVAVGRNYGEHAAEVGDAGTGTPNAFIKLNSSLIPTEHPVKRPAWTEELDYETELVIVIGQDCDNVDEAKWRDYVFGYTVMNDVSARNVQYQERKDGNILIGKNFPSAAPLGPCILTADEVADPHDMRLLTRVNGELRQDSSTGDQIHKVPRQVAWFSRLGFKAGDLISTGSPAGTAAGYKGPGTWFLQPGQVLESEIVGIGTLRNQIV